MKIVGIILRYYLLALMLFPCTDGQCEDLQGQELTSHWTAQDKGHHHPHDLEGDCSPLCACQCCHLHYFVSIPVEIPAIYEYPIGYEEHVPELFGIQLFDFLKPPKV